MGYHGVPSQIPRFSAGVQGSTAGDFAVVWERGSSELAALWNGDVFQAGAAIESAQINERDTVVGNDDASETGALIESPPSDGGNTIGNGDAGQAGAALESPIFNGSDTVGNGDIGQTAAKFESRFFNGSDTAGNCDTGQAPATIESTRFDGSNTVRNGNAGQAGGGMEWSIHHLPDNSKLQYIAYYRVREAIAI